MIPLAEQIEAVRTVLEYRDRRALDPMQQPPPPAWHRTTAALRAALDTLREAEAGAVDEPAGAAP